MDSIKSSQAPQAPSQGMVPDLMKIGPAQVNTQMDVETDILEPVVFNQKFTRFRLQNKGILHSNSKLTFAVDVKNHAAGKCAFPLNVGVHAIIDRCVLKAGNKTICETSDFGHFSAYQSSFINPQHNKQREAYTTARMMCRKWIYDNDTDASNYTLDFGIDNSEIGGAAAHINDIPRVCEMEKNGGDSLNGTKTSPVYQIALNDLFPFLKMNQLPLYMFKEDIDLELHYSASHKRGFTKADHNTDFHIDQLECSMIADYIFYPQEMMEAYANANSQMSFTYVDYRLNKRTIDNSADTSQTAIQNVGGAGRIVNKLFYSLSQDKAAGTAEQSPFNVYTAQGTLIDRAAVAVASRHMGVLSHNIRYNDNYLYPIDITNRARLYSNLAQSHGSNPFISKDEYSGEQNLITTENVMGRELDTNLSTKLQFVEDRLNRNERVNSRGIELYETWGGLPGNVFTWRVYLEIVRMATLTDGILVPVFA
jgi:hypothetical protein